MPPASSNVFQRSARRRASGSQACSDGHLTDGHRGREVGHPASPRNGSRPDQHRSGHFRAPAFASAVPQHLDSRSPASRQLATRQAPLWVYLVYASDSAAAEVELDDSGQDASRVALRRGPSGVGTVFGLQTANMLTQRRRTNSSFGSRAGPACTSWPSGSTGSRQTGSCPSLQTIPEPGLPPRGRAGRASAAGGEHPPGPRERRLRLLAGYDTPGVSDLLPEERRYGATSAPAVR
jgi:hypothetical protein